MAKPKEARNRLFIEDWQRGLNNETLAQKYNLSEGGVKALKQRLRTKDPSLYIKPLASKPAIQQTSKLAEYKKVTYYLDPKMVKAIKRLAIDRDMDISAIVREALSEWISQQVDK